PDVEVEDLLPAASIAEVSFGDGPEAVVPLDGDGALLRTRGGGSLQLLRVQRRSLNRVRRSRQRGSLAECHVGRPPDRGGDGRREGTSWLDGRGEHEDSSDEARRGHPEAGEEERMGRWAAPDRCDGLENE